MPPWIRMIRGNYWREKRESEPSKSQREERRENENGRHKGRHKGRQNTDETAGKEAPSS